MTGLNEVVEAKVGVVVQKGGAVGLGTYWRGRTGHRAAMGKRGRVGMY